MIQKWVYLADSSPERFEDLGMEITFNPPTSGDKVTVSCSGEPGNQIDRLSGIIAVSENRTLDI